MLKVTEYTLMMCIVVYAHHPECSPAPLRRQSPPAPWPLVPVVLLT